MYFIYPLDSVYRCLKCNRILKAEGNQIPFQADVVRRKEKTTIEIKFKLKPGFESLEWDFPQAVNQMLLNDTIFSFRMQLLN